LRCHGDCNKLPTLQEQAW